MKLFVNFFVALVLMLSIASCNKAEKRADTETEALIIKGILDNQFRLIQNRDTKALKDFLMKHETEKVIIVDRDTIFEYSDMDKTEEQLEALYFQTHIKYIEFKPLMEPIIRFSKDMTMAYAIDSRLVETKADSLGTIIQSRDKYTYLLIFVKSDSLWKMSDYMQGFVKID